MDRVFLMNVCDQPDFIRLSIKGASAVLAGASAAAGKAIAERGPHAAVGFPQTQFFLPFANALLNAEVRRLGQLEDVFKAADSLIRSEQSLSAALDAGLAALLCAEIIEAIGYLDGRHPSEGWGGFLGDAVSRSLGLAFADARLQAVCVILGGTSRAEEAAVLIRELRSKNILTLLCGSAAGTTFKDQLASKKVPLGLDSCVVALGPETTAAVYAANFISRMALTFGGLRRGQPQDLLRHVRERMPVFMLALGDLDELQLSVACGFLKLGFSVVVDRPIVEFAASGALNHGALAWAGGDYADLVSKAIELRGIRIRVDRIDVPVPCSAAFEGERIRDEEMSVEFGGGRSTAFEYLRLRPHAEIKDGVVDLRGQEIDKMTEGVLCPLGIVVDMAGKKMEPDFEPVLERQIHRFLNYAMGVSHTGRRDMNCIRISKDARAAGFKIRDLGKILHAQFHNEYGNIIDRVGVTLLTSEEGVRGALPEVRRAYAARDERLKHLRDDAVDKFYGCTICSSFAPNHVCVISPERPGLCGAISWLDAKTAYEIAPTGGNRPIELKDPIDPVKGEWEGVNEFVYDNSHQTIKRLCLYSLMEAPMSGCGCFECIAAVMPEANGIIVVNREYDGMTPIGMKFETLAGSAGGGRQTPGFMGIARKYVTSRMFMAADGGLARLVWMPKGLKDLIRGPIEARLREMGMPGFSDKIADETVCVDAEGLIQFLKDVGHPCFSMPALVADC